MTAVRAPRPVAYHRLDPDSNPNGHDHRTKLAVAERLAAVLGVECLGDLSAEALRRAHALVVPSDTVQGAARAAELGIDSIDDLFGGVVPFPFVATKLISHPLVAADARAPCGWSARFGEAVQSVVLPGYSVFTASDGLQAGQALLRGGEVRLKEPNGVGGAGQHVVRSDAELRERLAALDPDDIAASGLVLERNLAELSTLSVGQVRVGRRLIAYCGTQDLTRNHHDDEVYGGSRLLVVRGGYDALLALALTPAQRLAVEQALAYHRLAMESFPGLMASRTNYDIAQGRDGAGAAWSGVLEQSWRIGGASAAEIAALGAFEADPTLQVVRASTTEVYGDDVEVPDDAWVTFQGVDEHVGRLTKFAQVEAHADV